MVSERSWFYGTARADAQCRRDWMHPRSLADFRLQIVLEMCRLR